MMAVTEEVEVWLHREPVDFRRQINGLVLIVEQEMEADPFAKRVYAFTNRRRDRARLLYWDRNGFALWLKRLEKDRFPWPDDGAETIVVGRRGAAPGHGRSTSRLASPTQRRARRTRHHPA
jgi:transposase